MTRFYSPINRPTVDVPDNANPAHKLCNTRACEVTPAPPGD